MGGKILWIHNSTFQILYRQEFLLFQLVQINEDGLNQRNTRPSI